MGKIKDKVIKISKFLLKLLFWINEIPIMLLLPTFPLALFFERSGVFKLDIYVLGTAFVGSLFFHSISVVSVLIEFFLDRNSFLHNIKFLIITAVLLMGYLLVIV